MYPTLYHAVLGLLGLDLQVLKLVNTFGLLVALGFFGAARSLASELERKHKAGLLAPTRRLVVPERPPTLAGALLSGALAFVFGFKFFGVALGKYSLQGGNDTQRYLLSTQGHFWAGLIFGIGWMLYRMRGVQRGVPVPVPQGPVYVDVAPREHTLGITGAVALGSIIGAKLFHLLERPQSILELIEHPSMAALFSGLTIYGGLIVGTLFAYRYCRRHELPFVHVADSAAPGLMLGYCIGRLGCQLSGDGDWGTASAGTPSGFNWLPSWFFAFDYPNNVIGSGVPMASGGFAGYGKHLVPAVYPTPLYESLAALACFALLWSVRKRIERPLVMFALYLVLNGIERFAIEAIRVNATYDLFGHAVTQAQIISVLMFAGGLVLAYWQLRKAPAPPLDTPKAPASME